MLVCAADGSAITGALRGPGAASGIETFAVPTLASLPEDLGTRWDAVVVEDDRPGWSAEALLDHIRARGVSIPVVVVCAPSDEATGIALVERGAADCLASDRLARLPVAVRAAVEREALSRKLMRAEAAAPDPDQMLQAAFQQARAATITIDPAGCVAAWNAAAERLLGWTEAEARGQRLTDLVGGDDRGTRLTRMIAEAFEEHTPGRQIVPVKLRRRDGQPLHFEVSAARRQDDLAGAVVSFTDVTERWQTEFLKNCQLGFLRALGSPDEDAALLGALEQIGLSVNGTDVGLWEADARGVVRLRAVWSRAGYDPTTEPSTQAVPSALVTRAMSSRGLSFSEASPARPVGESLGVPVLNGEHALGAIEISAPDFAGFDDAQAAHLTGLGNYLGIYCAQRRSAADFARSLEELNRVSGERLRLMRLLVEAHEDERRTIAADIHDDSLQILAAVGLRLHTLRRRVNDEAARSTLGAVEQMVGTAISRLRGLMFNLRPTGLDHGDLLGTIRDRLTQVQQDEGIEFSLAGSEPVALTTAARVTLYRVAQEAIANVVKHASASHISVSVEERDDGCLMQITDDGAGFGAAAASPPGHLGLPSMRERTEVAGGWLRVEAGALRGTVVTAWVPLLIGARSDLGSVP